MSGATTERPWQPWERNFSGGRIGVQEQQGADENWMILHVESGGVKTTTSLRHHEAWVLALMISPQLKARLDELQTELRAQRDALHSLTYRGVETDLLRKLADDQDCGSNCETVGLMDRSTGCHECPASDRGECGLDNAEGLRALANAIDTANAATEADVLRAIDSCGGTSDGSEPEWSRGYNDALDAAEKEVKRLFAKAKAVQS